MTATLSPDHLGLPPPTLDFDLTDGDVTVGCATGDTIAFRGFASETEAAHAAWLAHRTLRRHLARRDGTRPIPVDTLPLAIRPRDGGEGEEILAGGEPIATLVRPRPEGGDDSFGFALRATGTRNELRLRAKAYLVYRALRKSGIRWALWRPARPLSSATIHHDAGRTP